MWIHIYVRYMLSPVCLSVVCNVHAPYWGGCNFCCLTENFNMYCDTIFWLLSHVILQHHHHHNRFMALFPGPCGWAGARRELLDFMVQGKINRGSHTDHPAGRHSIRTNHSHLHHPPIFFYGLYALPAAQPTVSKHWRLQYNMLFYSHATSAISSVSLM